jgi:hypothetical protein
MVRWTKTYPIVARHCVADELFVYCGLRLHVGSQDLSVLCEVEGESFTSPASDRFHNIERDTPEEVLQSETNPDSVTLERINAGAMTILLRCEK